jgi:hypothetical protein
MAPPKSTRELTPFEMGLRGAFQKMGGLNHFQPLMVLSLKASFFYFSSS